MRHSFLLVYCGFLTLRKPTLLWWKDCRKPLASFEADGIGWNWWKPPSPWKHQAGIGGTCPAKVGICPWLRICLFSMLLTATIIYHRSTIGIYSQCLSLPSCRYLQKDKVSGPEGNTTFYELAERALDGPVSEKIKEHISQVLSDVKSLIILFPWFFLFFYSSRVYWFWTLVIRSHQVF